MDEEIGHPLFGYRVSYRRIIEVQIRLLARYLSGEIDEYPPFATR
jgi:CRISP-associated protein Cas1